MMSDWQRWKKWRNFELPWSLDHMSDNKTQNRDKQQDELLKNLSSLDWTDANVNQNLVPEELKLYMVFVILILSRVHFIWIKIGFSSI